MKKISLALCIVSLLCAKSTYAQNYYIVGGELDGTVKLWERYTREIIQTYTGEYVDKSIQIFTGHTNAILAAKVSKDKKKVVSCSADGTIKTWNIQAGKEIDNYEFFDPTIELAPMDSAAFYAGPEQVKFIDYTNYLYSFFPPDEFKIFDIRKKEITKAFKIPLNTETEAITHVDFSDDGKKIVYEKIVYPEKKAAEPEAEYICIYDIKTKTEIKRKIKNQVTPPQAIKFNPQSNAIATILMGKLEMLDLGLKPIKTFAKSGPDAYFEFSYTGKFLAHVPSLVGNTINIYDTKTGKREHTMTIDPVPYFFVFSPDDTSIIFPSNRGIKIWSIENNKLLKKLNGAIGGLSCLSVMPFEKQIPTQYADIVIHTYVPEGKKVEKPEEEEIIIKEVVKKKK